MSRTHEFFKNGYANPIIKEEELPNQLAFKEFIRAQKDPNDLQTIERLYQKLVDNDRKLQMIENMYERK